MSKNHLKRIALPRTWALPRKSVNRKKMKFASKPTAGKNLFLSMSLNNVVKDLLKLASTKKEVKAILQFKHLFVNGKRVRDEKFPVGIFDVISFDELDSCYRLTLNKFGKLSSLEVDCSEKEIQVKKILGKTIMKGNKLQLNLFGSSNITVSDVKESFKVGDSIVIKNKKYDSTLPLASGSLVMLTGGRYMGHSAVVKEIKDHVLFIELDGKVVETLTKYAYVIGKNKPIIKVVE